MSSLIGQLAFEQTGLNMFFDERLGSMLGPLLSRLADYLVLRYSLSDGKIKAESELYQTEN